VFLLHRLQVEVKPGFLLEVALERRGAEEHPETVPEGVEE